MKKAASRVFRTVSLESTLPKITEFIDRLESDNRFISITQSSSSVGAGTQFTFVVWYWWEGPYIGNTIAPEIVIFPHADKRTWFVASNDYKTNSYAWWLCKNNIWRRAAPGIHINQGEWQSEIEAKAAYAASFADINVSLPEPVLPSKTKDGSPW